MYDNSIAVINRRLIYGNEKWVTPTDSGCRPMTPCMVAHVIAARTSLRLLLEATHLNCSDPPQLHILPSSSLWLQVLQSFNELASDVFLIHVSSFSFVSAAGTSGAPGPSRDVLQILRSLPDIQRSAYSTISVQILLWVSRGL